MRRILPALCLSLLSFTAAGPAAAAPDKDDRPRPLLIRPARVFDGSRPAHEGWVVLVKGDRIEAAGPADSVKTPQGARVIDLPDATLLPGLIDAHTHILLHPYNEASWDDQVLKQPLALRVCRATKHLRAI